MSTRKNTPNDPVSEDLRDRANADPITGSPGAHPVGTGVGAATGGAAGAAIGSVIPGVGTVVGGAVGTVVGAVAGGYAGKAVAESINPTDEEAYWRLKYQERVYYDSALDFDTDYAPAYRTAIENYNANPSRRFEDAENDLQARWTDLPDKTSRLDWERARQAMRDVYERDRKTGEGTKATPTTQSDI